MIIKFYNHAHRLSHTHRGRGAGPGRGPPARRAAARPRAPAVASESPPGHLRAVFRGFVCRRGPVRPRAGRGGAGARGGLRRGGERRRAWGGCRARGPRLSALFRAFSCVFYTPLHAFRTGWGRRGEPCVPSAPSALDQRARARPSRIWAKLVRVEARPSQNRAKLCRSLQNARIEAAPPAQSRPQLAHPGCNARTAVQ